MPTGKKPTISILPVVGALLLGQAATFSNLAPWYADLVKPSFNPPTWIFGPVWITLYALMAVAIWRILGRDVPEKRGALVLFFAQLAFNAAWPWMFFGMHSPLLGFCNILPQWFLIVASLIVFWRIDRLAGLCLLPLAFWVAFATVLNFEVWRLN